MQYSQPSNETPASIDSLLNAYRTGELTPSGFLTEKLEQARTDSSNVWISCIQDSQLELYLENLSRQDADSLPLYGVPFAIKDNIDLEGLPTTAGCREYSYMPDSSSFVVQKLIDAGAVPLGKTNLDQFATGLVGTRSPWGETKNSFNPEYISGGSSSGSAVSVATGQVFFALGTDTAGSGRVPAAFNNLYGLKPTRGLLSCSGVVPACRSLDCVTFFTKSAKELELLCSVAAVYDKEDCFARPAEQASLPVGKTFEGLKVGVPYPEQLEFFGNHSYQQLFDASAARMASLGAELVPFDLQPFIEAAKLLYQGPWVAERYAAIESFFTEQPESCLPVIQTIIGGATDLTASEAFKAMYRLQEYKVKCDALLSQVDIVLTPTTGSTYTIEEVNADPVALNSNLGYYTNFMNLLDYSAIAIPAGFTENGLPFGITLFSRAFADASLTALAAEWQKYHAYPLGATGKPPESKEITELLVCGAHMSGLPLNHQLTSLGGSFKMKTRTAANYRLFKLSGGAPYRPGLVRDETHGELIEVEIWRLPVSEMGKLLAQIPHPLGLGRAELESGEWVTSFICEPVAMEGAQEITEYGGWRAFCHTLE